MKKLILLLVLSASQMLASYADEPPAEAISALTVEEIRSGAADIGAIRYLSTGQPDAEVLANVKAAGFVAVVDLRSPGEPRGIDEAAEVEALGMRYISIPVADIADVNFDNAAKLDVALAGIDGPVLLHCASGNRVGALFALRASSAGASAAESLAIGKRAGLTRWASAVSERLADPQ